MFLAIVLIVGTFAAITPSFMIGAHAQQYGIDQQKYNSYESDNGMDNSYDNKQSYGKDSNSYDKSKDSSSAIVKKIKCNNINANVNGFNGATLPTALNGLATDDEAQASADEGETGANSFESGSGSNVGRPSGHDMNSRFVCINNNDFAVVGGEPVPPTPPTGSITVNKEIFGCNIIVANHMDCFDLPNDSPLWLPCTDPTISNTPFCQNLSPNQFDIEVLGEIQQFEGSTAGTTVQNLQPDSFRVNEIVHEDFVNQLGYSPTDDSDCKLSGFDGGGRLSNVNTQTFYSICFEYEDEQGNDCNPITIGAEEKTCTVKNHIRTASQV
jgi:hypothetical protein